MGRYAKYRLGSNMMNPKLRLTEKKGQGAFEYIMSYGWAIIIILIIGVAMWYLGAFNIEQTAATFSGFSVIKPLMTTVILTTGGNFSGMFINGASYDIRTTAIGITNEDGKSCDISRGLNIDVPATGEFIIMAENCTISGIHKDGDVFVLHVNISYNGVIGTAPISRTEYGKLRGLYGAGAYVNPYKPCSEWGGTCCAPGLVCDDPKNSRESEDCGSSCCVGTCTATTTTITTTTIATTSTTTTTTTTTTVTTTTSITTTTILGSYVGICGDYKYCGVNDNVCPADFGVTCTPADTNCF
jgi:hypothetical protein